MSTTMIPSLSGYSSKDKEFEKFFASTCERDENGTILRGEVGVGYGLRADLSVLWARASGDQRRMMALIQSYNRHDHWKTHKKVNHSCGALLIEFYKFVISTENDLFFLRKGRQVLGLYRRTSRYIFREWDQGNHFHRFAFERVRDCTEAESKQVSKENFPASVVPAFVEVPYTPPGAAPPPAGEPDARDTLITEMREALKEAQQQIEHLRSEMLKFREVMITTGLQMGNTLGGATYVQNTISDLLERSQ